MKSQKSVSPDMNSGENSGSPSQGEPTYLTVGRFRKPHGVKGEVSMDILTDFPDRIVVGKKVYVGESYQPMEVSNIRWHQQMLLLSFEGIEDRDQAGFLRNQLAFVKSDGLPELPEGEYYFHQLIGLTVVDESKKIIGKLEDILETGANDVYVVRTEAGEEILLPAIEAVILDVDLENKQMIVRPPEWI